MDRKNKPWFDNLHENAKKFDKLYIELNHQLSGVTSLEPASTLDELNKRVPELLDAIQPSLAAIKKRNQHMTKTLELVRTAVEDKKKIISNASAKIAEFTVDETPISRKTAEPKSAHPATKVGKETGTAVNNTSKQQRTLAQTPLKSVENVAEAVPVDNVEGEKTTPISTPPRSGQVHCTQVATPKLTDFLSLDDMYSMMEKDKLFTKSSTKSSAKKLLSAAKDKHSNASAVGGSSIKSRKTLILSTPGKSRVGEGGAFTPVRPDLLDTDCQAVSKTPATGRKQALDVAPSTPIPPKLLDVPKFDFTKFPKPDFSGRIAMIDVEEFHTQIDDYIKNLISLELLNKVINKVELLFNLTPEEPVKREDLLKLVVPLAGAKAKLSINLMVQLRRLKPVGDGEELMAVYGSPS